MKNEAQKLAEIEDDTDLEEAAHRHGGIYQGSRLFGPYRFLF